MENWVLRLLAATMTAPPLRGCTLPAALLTLSVRLAMPTLTAWLVIVRAHIDGQGCLGSDLLANEFLYLFEQALLLLLIVERIGFATGSRPTRAPDTVHIVLGIKGQFKIHYRADPCNIQPSRGHISGYQYWRLLFFKAI